MSLELCLPRIPQLMTHIIACSNAGSPAHWARPRIKPASSWILVWFVSAVPQRKLLTWDLLMSLSGRKIAPAGYLGDYNHNSNQESGSSVQKVLFMPSKIRLPWLQLGLSLYPCILDLFGDPCSFAPGPQISCPSPLHLCKIWVLFQSLYGGGCILIHWLVPEGLPYLHRKKAIGRFSKESSSDICLCPHCLISGLLVLVPVNGLFWITRVCVSPYPIIPNTVIHWKSFSLKIEQR